MHSFLSTRPRPPFFLSSLFAALLLCLCAAPARAQTTSTLTGVARDQQGSVVAGASIRARSLETNLTRETTSDEEGLFTFPSLSVGVYEVRAEREGFKPYTGQAVLTVNETATLNIDLEVGGIEPESVTVTDQTALVNTQTPELSYLVGERSISGLPLNGRNYTDLALLQPGVVSFQHRDGGSVVAHGLGTSVNGQDPRSNVYLLDGTPQNDFTNGPAGSAAGTALGTEAVREFRVETSTYGAEFGRNFGGQINVVTKSGTNEFHGSLYEFHRNDNLDAANFFDNAAGLEKPEFRRNQFGGSIGGPIRREKLFFFAAYESLRENLGRTISTFVPDLDAREGFASTAGAVAPAGQPCPNRQFVGVNAAVQPYLNEFPLPNSGASRVCGNLAGYTFGFEQQTREHFLQGRIDYNLSDRQQFFARYTLDDADQLLPTDFPQFPRTFLSRNQFFTGEYRLTSSASTIHTFRLNANRTRVGQNVEANLTQTLAPFVPGQALPGGIDIGGIPGRFGPQTSANLRLTQNVFGGEYGMVHSRGRHLIKAGGLAEYYQDNMVNPTFSLGVFTFNSVRDFLRNTPARFLGISPGGALDRYWRFTLFGAYAQDTFRVSDRLTLTAGLRYEYATMPEDKYGRDVSLPNLRDPAPTQGPLYQNPTTKNLSPRVGFAWDVTGDGKTALRGGFGVYFNTNNQQNLIVTVTNPPATPRPIIVNPTFPVPASFAGQMSIRPVQYDLQNPYLQVWNLNVQRELGFDTVVTVGYAGSRGVHLLRSSDVNTPAPVVQADGSLFFPAGQTRPNTAFTTIELKSSDGNSWYNAGILEVRKRLSRGLTAQASYTFSRNIDTTQASTFFSDATNGTTTAFPEFPGLNYNKGLADYHAKHNFVLNFVWDLPWSRDLRGTAGAFLGGWQLAGIGQLRSGNPLTVFVQRNRSRSQWSPSIGPGQGFDRPSLAPGFTAETAVLGTPEQYFNPAAFVLQPAGRLGSLGRGTFIGPNLKTFDLSGVKNTRLPWLGEQTVLQLRVEAFNLFNRANFAPPSLLAFTGTADGELPLSTFGRIRSTVTSSRQIQLGLRLVF